MSPVCFPLSFENFVTLKLRLHHDNIQAIVHLSSGKNRHLKYLTLNFLFKISITDECSNHELSIQLNGILEEENDLIIQKHSFQVKLK